MDMPFLKFDNFEQTPTVPENTAPVTTSSSTGETDDVFNSLVAELIKGEVMTTGHVDAHNKPEVKTEKAALPDQIDQPLNPGQNPDFDLTTLVAQLNMAQPANPDMQIDVPQQLSEESMIQKPVVATNMKNLQNNLPLTPKNFVGDSRKLPTDKMRAPGADTLDADSLLDDELTQLADSQLLAQTDIDKKQLDANPKLVLPAMQQTQAVQSTVTDLPKMPELKPNLHSKPVAEIDAKNPVAAVPAQQPVLMDATKALNAFTQLGGFINSHTQNIKTDDAVKADFKSTLDAMQTADNHLEVELVPKSLLPSMSALTHESYNAKIKIYPPELGHVTAELKFDKGEAQLHIITESRQVKDVVEANISQLKEKFQSVDINLSNVNVQVSQQGARDSQQQQQQQQQNNHGMSQNGATDDTNRVLTDGTTAREKRNIDSLVDTYV